MNDFAAGYRAALADVDYLLLHRTPHGQLFHTLRATIAKYETDPEAVERAKRRVEEDAAAAQP